MRPHICVTDFMCKPWLLRYRRIWADRNHFYRMCSHIYVTDSYVCHDSFGTGGFEQIGTISIVCAPTPSCECSGIDVWCHIYEWVMSRIWMSHVTYMNESCHIYERVMSHIWMSHTTYMNESCHIKIWGLSFVTLRRLVMSHIWMSHVTHMNEPCHTYEWVMSHQNLRS